MRGHLRLYYSSQEGSDEQVLGTMPSALRRRVLRHLYLGDYVLIDIRSWTQASNMPACVPSNP
jgi:hypothetical protein